METWVKLCGYNDIHEISNFGRIRNGSKVLKPYLNNGYLKVTLYKGSKRCDVQVHRLVALHFIDNEFNKPYVNHKDGDKTNNVVENLEWVTKSENTQHAYNTGLKVGMCGEKHPMAKLTKEQVEEIRAIGKTQVLREIASKYGVGKSMIWYIINNKNWIGGA